MRPTGSEPRGTGRVEAVAIGASAGAIEALSVLLPALPADFAAPLVVVVHLPRNRESAIPSLFAPRCRVRIKEAEDKEPLVAGTVYFAPPDYHLLIETDGRLSLSADEPVMYSRPSIDVLFESAAEAYGKGLVGIVLTGANSDGARGLGRICAAGGRAWVQAPDTAMCDTMPRAALAACPGAEALTLEDMTKALIAAMEDGR